jgi:hypothetical protein
MNCEPPSAAPVLPALMLVCAALLAGCGSKPEENTGEAVVRGQPIPSSTRPAPAPAAALPGTNDVFARPDVVEDGFIRLGFDKLSAFKFEVYEYYSETNSGRPLLRSNDTIPPAIKAYDGRRVTVTGFALPLRTKRGLVTEFLLTRDLGTCCFGPQAQINHFMRVKFPGGFKHEGSAPWKVSGTIRVGEIYIQGYLTGIYQLEAESVVPAEAPTKAD